MIDISDIIFSILLSLFVPFNAILLNLFIFYLLDSLFYDLELIVPVSSVHDWPHIPSIVVA